MNYVKKSLVGNKYGLLTVIERDASFKKRVRWICKCDCGSIHRVISESLKNGHTKSCGCLRGKKNAVSGGSHSKEYQTWSRMKNRCYNIKDKGYRIYGGRGITVCDSWLESYENFISDMGRAPSPMHSIDRINNDGNYEPTNCRWATVKEQSNNRSFTIKITHQGETKSLKEWCEHFKLHYGAVQQRIYTHRWNPITAITTPIRAIKRKKYVAENIL